MSHKGCQHIWLICIRKSYLFLSDVSTALSLYVVLCAFTLKCCGKKYIRSIKLFQMTLLLTFMSFFGGEENIHQMSQKLFSFYRGDICPCTIMAKTVLLPRLVCYRVNTNDVIINHLHQPQVPINKQQLGRL